MPFIVHAPRLSKAGTTNHWLINNTDFAPTILDLAGVEETPEYIQGRSFADALEGKAKPSNWRHPLTIAIGCIWLTTLLYRPTSASALNATS